MANLDIAVFFFLSVLLRSHLCKKQQCPSIYMRFSQEHSSCQPKNRKCSIFQSKVGPEGIKRILDLHNFYRNCVAMGEEKRAGGLPQAADMMQMVWDEELATIAQKRAEQCRTEHDCDDCRRVENFPVGQNIANRNVTCLTSDSCHKDTVPQWDKVSKMFYDEVADFNQKYLNSLEFTSGPAVGHFTQMIWSKTWRIGCGYVAYKKRKGFHQSYVCNYGPSGNEIKNPVYETGPPCGSCPVNSCCGETCKSADYPGLCKMDKDDEAPVYKSTENFLFDCDFRSTDGDCSYSVSGKDKWKVMNSLGGPFAEIVLKGGETTALNFKKVIQAKQNFCLGVKYRFGPAMFGEKVSGEASLAFELGSNKPETSTLPSPGTMEFFEFSMDIGWSDDTLVSINFSVPADDPKQFFDVQLVTAKEGKC